MAIRSGRFKSNSVPAAGIVIIKGKSGLFRVYNSGEENFILNAGLIIKPECSVDVEVSTDVTVTATAGKKVEGSYEFVSPRSRIRNGRFTESMTIIDTGTKTISYRILNSGENDITVSPDGADAITLKPAFSIDIAAKGNVEVSGGNIAGIYDVLDAERETKSGRFKIPVHRDAVGAPLPNPAYPHKIIDLKVSGGNPAWYRLFNSGEVPIIIQEKKAPAATVLGVVAPKNSLDFAVTNQPIFVRPDDDGDGKITDMGDNVGAIDGSYEYLGTGG